MVTKSIQKETMGDQTNTKQSESNELACFEHKFHNSTSLSWSSNPVQSYRRASFDVSYFFFKMGGNESEHLTNFSGHCELYFKKSLSTRNNDYKSNDHNPHNHDHDLQACEVILDALEHQLINVHMDFVTKDLKEFLVSDRAMRYRTELESCGLFIDLENTDHDEEEAKADDANANENSITNINTDGCILPQSTLLEYTKVRDQKRRSAHKDQMEERRILLQELIQEKSTSKKRERNDFNNFMGVHDVTSQDYLKHVRDIFRNFVTKYASNIGTHSFLAGINELIKKQINVKGEDLIGWTLNGSTISEVNINLSVSHGSGEDAGNYMEDAVELLTAFMVPFLNSERVEKGEQKEYESLHSFHIHPCISNSFLMAIRRELPIKKLEARPTGKFDMISNSSDKTIETRTNVNGYLDESRWGALQYCDIL